MERHHLFEAALVLALIGLAGLLYLAIVSTPPAPASWETQANGSIDYMFVGSDDTLYAFSGNNVTAIGKDSSVLWDLTVPGDWKVLGNWTMAECNIAVVQGPGVGGFGSSYAYHNYPVACTLDGYLYVYALSPITADEIEEAGDASDIADLSGLAAGQDNVSDQSYDRPAIIIAISPAGTIAWESLVPGSISANSIRYMAGMDDAEPAIMPSIKAQDGRIYLFHDNEEDVFDQGGRLLFTLGNISGPAAVDEDGRLYTVRGSAQKLWWPEVNVSTSKTGLGLVQDPAPANSTIVDAYDPDGTLEWSTGLDVNMTGLYVTRDLWPSFNSIPVYANHTLYVPVSRGVAALGLDGRLEWVRQVRDGPYEQNEWADPELTAHAMLSIMPVDSHGNAYLAKLDWDGTPAAVYVISPDGNVSPPEGDSGRNAVLPGSGLESLAGQDGTIYAFDNGASTLTETDFNASYGAKQLDAGAIVAYGVRDHAILWNVTVPTELVTAEALNASNVENALLRPGGIQASGYNGTFSIMAQKDVNIYPGPDVIYVCYYYAVYEKPVVDNQSRCIYADCLLAIDRNGTVLWAKPVDGFVTQAAAGNSAFYYLTSGGMIGKGGSGGVAAGFALLAAVYLFLRFFVVGAVSRARTRLDRNDNRNRAYRYIVDNPGATAVDLSRDLGMNIGTIRYHLFVLTINHRVVGHRETGKYLRYFTNAGTYTPEERGVLSLLRREPLRKMAGLLAESPGLTSLELARRLGVSTTVAHRHINELLDGGVIVKVCGTDRGNVFYINEQYDGIVTKALGRPGL